MFTNIRPLAAILAAAALADGHMIMQSPKPFGLPGLDNSPLTAGNYPCKVKGDPATFYAGDLENTMAIGETQTLSFKGLAVHGGGSCQLALTDDLQPSVSTSWKVIQSIQGGCPSKNGNSPDTYDFTIPEGIAPGKYVFAWTWISKESGTGEFYMNCGPVTVTGGKSKRFDNETQAMVARDAQFPELFVANLADINDCKSELSSDVRYPEPGPDAKSYGTPKLANVKGQNCVPKGVKVGTGGGGNADGGTNKAGPSAAPPSSGAGAPASRSLPVSFITRPASGGGSKTTAASVATSTRASSTTAAKSSVETDVCTPSKTGPRATAVASSSTSTHSPISSTTRLSSLSTSASSSSTPSSSSSTPSSPSSTVSAPPATSSGAAGAQTGPCSQEGMFNCIGGTSYQQCASGSWSSVLQLAPSVKCKEGMSTTLWPRDESPHSPDPT
ncbi:hypothetical protein GGR52DRAFT_249252 [Hypoxylon sp. FL1284]|nr:hypothetical protein GGR52DRAFT_249252 [Hypoxylon sp. FL1284]